MSYQPNPQQPPNPYPPVVPGSPAPQQYGQPYPPPGYPQQVVVAAGPPTSAWATASLVFGIIGALGGWCMFAIPCFIAVVCGHAALRETNGGVKSGRGMAQAGLILGYLFVGPILAVVFMGGFGAVLPDPPR